MPRVIKADGSTEDFSEDKVIRSIHRAGIPATHQKEVLAHVKSKLYENIPTSEIYHHIIEFLGNTDLPYAKASYSLKQAIMLLGPTGYPFEDFIAVVLHSLGFHTKTRQVLLGNCVNHEVDVVAEQKGKRVMVEAKFHNSSGTRSDLHVALYTKSRFDDLKTKHKFNEAWLVTNTKATTDAVAYAKCCDLSIISWQYPENGSLRDLIEKHRLHPVTSLTTLTQPQIQKLLDNHVVVCRDIASNPMLLSMLELPLDEKNIVMDEISYIVKTNT